GSDGEGMSSLWLEDDDRLVRFGVPLSAIRFAGRSLGRAVRELRSRQSGPRVGQVEPGALLHVLILPAPGESLSTELLLRKSAGVQNLREIAMDLLTEDQAEHLHDLLHQIL